jgi:hypothetical protein
MRSSAPWSRTPRASIKLVAMTAWLLANTAERDIVLSMLVVGLVFIAVIALGETARWLTHRRR